MINMKPTKAAKNKNKQKKEQQVFIKDVKKGKYGTVERSSVVYTRLPVQAEPYDNTQKTHIYYGVR